MDDADAIVDNFPADLADGEGAGFAGSDDESSSGGESVDSDGTIWILDEEWALPQIKRNDPNLTAVSFHGEESQDVDWEKNAHFIGENTRLTQVSIDSYTEPSIDDYKEGDLKAHMTRKAQTDNFEAFCKGVGANTSIEALRLARCSIWGGTATAAIASLLPLFVCGNLRTFKIKNSDPLPESLLASLLKNCHSLKHVMIYGCKLQKIGLGLAIVIEALEGKENLRKIDLGLSADAGWDGRPAISSSCWEWCLRLGNLLQNPKCAVAEMALQIDGMDKTCIAFLATSLAKNRSVASLDLSGNTMSTTPTTMDPDAWCAFATSLQKHSFFSLEELDLSENYMNDDVLTILGSAVASSTKLKSLALRDNIIGLQAWEAFLSTVCTASALVELDISGNPIGNRPLLGVASELANNTTLKKLCLRGACIGDVGAIALKNRLLTNSTLEDLDLSLNAGIGERSLKAFCELLCNPSSIDDTYASNHTLLPEMSCDDLGLAAELAGLRMTNRAFDAKWEVARHKVIHTHLISRHGRVNVDAFLDMEVGVLPRAIAWVGRERDRNVVAARHSFSVLYKLLLALPSLFEVRAAECKKRKRGV